jgi:hypothetical protein
VLIALALPADIATLIGDLGYHDESDEEDEGGQAAGDEPESDEDA